MASHAFSMVGLALLATPTEDIRNFPLSRVAVLSTLANARGRASSVHTCTFRAGGEVHEVRVLRCPLGAYFLPADIGPAIGIADVAGALAQLPDEEAFWIHLRDYQTLEGGQLVAGAELDVPAVDEAGLYSLIHGTADADGRLGARARQFEKWITHEVLPALYPGLQGRVVRHELVAAASC